MYIYIYIYNRGGLTTHGAPRQQGIMGPLCPCPNSKNLCKRYQGHLKGPPTDPGPSGSVQVTK
ncbi:unnamed protein product, partial [Staurois parvus]